MFQRLGDNLKTAYGELGSALALAEPLAQILLHDNADKLAVVDCSHVAQHLLPITQFILMLVKYPTDRQALESTRRVVFGSDAGTLRLFENVYVLLCMLLQQLYNNSMARGIPPKDGHSLVDSMATTISATPAEYAVDMLTILQDGIAIWAQDEQAIINNNSADWSRMSQAVSITDTCFD